MRRVLLRAAGTAVAVGGLAAVAARALPVVLIVAAAAALVPLAGVAWWAVALAARTWHAHPENREPVLAELDNLVRTALGGTIVAGLGVNYLLGLPLPRGSGLVLLVAAVLLFLGRPVALVVRFYRRR